MYDKHIVIDLEFTPMDRPYRDDCGAIRCEIIQLGAVMLDADYRVCGSFCRLVKPAFTSHIAPKVSALTGIRDADVADAASLGEVLAELDAWVGSGGRGRVYSWSLTDLAQLCDECWLKGLPFPANLGRWMDLQRVFGRLIGCRRQLSLKYAVSSLELHFAGAEHSALYDALATAELLRLTRDRELFQQRTACIRALFVGERRCATIGERLGAELMALIA